MLVEKTEIQDVFVLIPIVHEDNRGCFIETFSEKTMEEYGVSLERGSSVKEKMAGPTFTKAKSSSNSTRKHERSRQSVSRCFVLRRERLDSYAPGHAGEIDAD